MATITIHDLVIAQAIKTREQANVSGGMYMTLPTNPMQPMPETMPEQSQGFVILGEDKYGGWGGEW